MSALVPGSPTGPEECQDLMALDFKAHYFQAFAYVPSYSEWLLDADLTSTYRYERRALKLLQWGAPTRPWRLKCPSHLLWLDHLDEVFPDARFVMTHRDPTEVMVSVADVYAEVGRQFSDGDRPPLPRASSTSSTGRRAWNGCCGSAPSTATTASTTWTSRPCSAIPSARCVGCTPGSDEPVTGRVRAGHAPVVGGERRAPGGEHPSRRRASSGSTSTRCAAGSPSTRRRSPDGPPRPRPLSRS